MQTVAGQRPCGGSADGLSSWQPGVGWGRVEYMKGEKWGARVGATDQLGLCGSLSLADSSQITTLDGCYQFTHIKGRAQ